MVDVPKPPQPEQRRVDQPPPPPPVDTRSLAANADRRQRPETSKPADNGTGLPPAPLDRSKYTEAPVFRLQDQMQKGGMSDQKMTNFRAELRTNPDLVDRLSGGNRDSAALLKDFAKVDTTPRERFIQPTAEVDRMLHQALGKEPGRYISQADLTRLTSDKELRGSGLSQSDVASVQGFLKETGRQLRDGGGDTRVAASDGRIVEKEDYGAHQMLREINANRESPLGEGAMRAMGASLETREHVAALSKLITETAGAGISHAAGLRGLHDSTNTTRNDPPGIGRTVDGKTPEARPPAPEAPGPKPDAPAPRDGGAKIKSEYPKPPPAGMSVNEMAEDKSIKRYDPGATPGVAKQPGVDWVAGDRKITTTQDVKRGGEVQIRQNVVGGEWVASKLLLPEAAPGEEAVSGLTAKTPAETRVFAAVDDACKKFDTPVRQNESSRSALMNDGSRLTMTMTDPTALVIHIEVPGLSRMPPERQVELQRIATDRVIDWTSKTPGVFHGKPLHARVVEAP